MVSQSTPTEAQDEGAAGKQAAEATPTAAQLPASLLPAAQLPAAQLPDESAGKPEAAPGQTADSKYAETFGELPVETLQALIAEAGGPLAAALDSLSGRARLAAGEDPKEVLKAFTRPEPASSSLREAVRAQDSAPSAPSINEALRALLK